MGAALPAAITAAGAIAGGALSSRSSNRATATQARANQEALAYQKAQDAKAEQAAKEQLAREQAEYQRQLDEIAPYREAALGILRGSGDRLGFTVGALAPRRTTFPTTANASAAGIINPTRSRTLSSIAAPSVLAPNTAPLTVRSLSDLANWSDWGEARRVN